MASEKPQFSPDTTEFNHEESSVRTLRKTSRFDSVRQGLTLLTFLTAISIVGMSANALAVYRKTHVSQDFYLALWPYNFNISPNIALVAGSSVAAFCDIISLFGSKIPAVRPLSGLSALQERNLLTCVSCSSEADSSYIPLSPSLLHWLGSLLPLLQHLSSTPSMRQPQLILCKVGAAGFLV
jgi:hypothetical protein